MHKYNIVCVRLFYTKIGATWTLESKEGNCFLCFVFVYSMRVLAFISRACDTACRNIQQGLWHCMQKHTAGLVALHAETYSKDYGTVCRDDVINCVAVTVTPVPWRQLLR